MDTHEIVDNETNFLINMIGLEDKIQMTGVEFHI